MIVVEETLRTSASPQRMWDVLTTHEEMPSWFKVVRKAVLDPAGRDERNGLGAVRHLHAVGPAVVEEVIEWEPPRRYVYALRGGAPIRNHRGEVTVEAASDGAKATWRIQFEPMIPLSGVVMRPLMTLLARTLLRNAAQYAQRS
ncbi:MAG: SRPBCC family protein [Nannocystaceae bacterium]|nr:SRPBCC family protein [bacterium]